MPTRRKTLQHSAIAASLLAGAGLFPQYAQAYTAAAFDAKSVNDALRALGAGAPVASKDVVLTAPDIAENGAVVPVGVAWLLFFPNAPYILTDLFHLERRSGVPFWYDLALILSCAWNGLMLAYASRADMQGLVQRRLGTGTGWAFATVALLLSSFGIYLGRYLRFNSWDVLTNPLTLFYDIVNRILHPFSFPGTWGVTLVFGVFLLIGYGTVRLLGQPHEAEPLG